MEIKDKSFSQPADGGAENKPDSVIKQRISNFLINYFGYLTLALALIIFAAGLFFFIYPKYQLMTTNDEIAKKNFQAEYEAKNNYLGAIRDLRKTYQPISGVDREKIKNMIPISEEVTGLIPEIESIVLRNGVVLNSIKIEKDLKGRSGTRASAGSNEKPQSSAGIFEQLPEGVGQVRVEINLSSVNYPVLKNLLKSFENNLRLFDIAKVAYNVQEGTAIFNIYFYYLLR